MTKFEQMLLEEIAEAKKVLSQDETLHAFSLTIAAFGRLDGEVKVTFTVANDWGGGGVEAGALAPALSEFLRRRGWEAQHAALLLPNARSADTALVSAPPPDGDIPF